MKYAGETEESVHFFPPRLDERAGDSLKKPKTSEQILFPREG